MSDPDERDGFAEVSIEKIDIADDHPSIAKEFLLFFLDRNQVSERRQEADVVIRFETHGLLTAFQDR